MTIPAGRYTVRGVKGSEQYGRSEGEKKTPQIGIDLEFIGGEYEGATATTILYFSEAAKQFSIDRLRALGWKGDDLTDLTGIDENEAMAVVKYETWEGKEQMKVEILTNGGGMKFKTQMSDADKRMFAASMKSTAAASMPRSQAAAPAGDSWSRSASGPKF